MDIVCPVSGLALSVEWERASPLGFVVQNMAAQKSKILPLSGSTSSDLNGKSCSPLTVQWTVDTYNLAKGVAKAVTEAGGTKWHFLTSIKHTVMLSRGIRRSR
jgi:hypothetical protein